jgi:hypothetical protein
MTDLTLRDLLIPPKTADRIWFQRRGKTFELVLNQLLSRENMEPRTSTRPDEEEIDGSFVMGDRFFLLEAKWHATPIPASYLPALLALLLSGMRRGIQAELDEFFAHIEQRAQLERHVSERAFFSARAKLSPTASRAGA